MTRRSRSSIRTTVLGVMHHVEPEVVAVEATACRASAVRERFGPRADVKCDAIVPAAWKENKKNRH